MVDKVWIPQGWDVSKWDQPQYVWDGQKGFNAALGTVTVSFNSANLVYGKRFTAQTGSIVVNGIPAVLHSGLTFSLVRGQINVSFLSANLRAALRVGATTSPIVVSGPDVVLRSGRSMQAVTGRIVVTPNPAGVIFTVAYHMGCGTGQIFVNGVAGQCNLTAFVQPGPLNFGIQRVMIPHRW